MKRVVVLSLVIFFQACGMEVIHDPAVISVSVENRTPKEYLLFSRSPTHWWLTKTIPIKPNATFHDDNFVLPYSDRDGYALHAKIQSPRFLFFTKTVASLRFYLNEEQENHNQNMSVTRPGIRASITSKIGGSKRISAAQEPMNQFSITLLPSLHSKHKLEIESALQT